VKSSEDSEMETGNGARAGVTRKEQTRNVTRKEHTRHVMRKETSLLEDSPLNAQYFKETRPHVFTTVWLNWPYSSKSWTMRPILRIFGCT
jgi:hypothetical protein